MRERRVRARERERTIAAAVRRYLEDWQAINTCETKRDSDIELLRQQIAEIQAAASTEIAQLRGDQAVVAALIRDESQTDDEVAELLEITVKQARQLISAGRVSMNGTAGDGTASAQVAGQSVGGAANGGTDRMAGSGAGAAAAPAARDTDRAGTAGDVVEDFASEEKPSRQAN